MSEETILARIVGALEGDHSWPTPGQVYPLLPPDWFVGLANFQSVAVR